MKHIELNKERIPQSLSSLITLSEHKKSAQYTLEKLHLSNYQNMFKFLYLLILICILHPYIFKIAFQSSDNLYKQAILYFALLSLIDFIFQVPFQYYSTFILEEKYGFNNTTLKTFIIDILKNTFISIVLFLPLVLLFILFISKFENSWWLYSWLSLILFQLAIMLLFPKFIAPLFNKFSPLEDEKLKEVIFKLIRKTGLSFKDIFVMDASKRSSHGNAYFTGFGKNKRIVFFDTILKQLKPKEIEAVMAHELGHFYHKHIHMMLLKTFVFSFLLFFLCFTLSKSEFFFDSFFVSKTPYTLLFLFSVILPYCLFLLTPITSHFSRKNEFQADRFACKYSEGKELITALLSLSKKNSNFVNPEKIYSQFYFSHPPLIERIGEIKRHSN